MLQKTLPSEWLELLIDPYAVLGISVNANDRQILKRYHQLAKLLHPDQYAKNHHQNQQLAAAILTNLVNPAYQKLKQTAKRSDTLAILRTHITNLDNQKVLSLSMANIGEILTKTALEAEPIYEQAIASQAENQYQSFDQLYQITQELNTLNLLYLSLPKAAKARSISQEIKPGETIITAPTPEHDKIESICYAQRHYERALEYAKQKKWAIAVQEVRDAIKLEPNNSDYHALLGVVHFYQNFPGMAKVYIRQALKLNPKQPLALKYATKLNIEPTENTKPQSMAKAVGIAGLLGRFLFRQDS
ncbi:MAG TPA: DnaJ domain-containing protein [Nostocaceae cyanobacterium]|nr:DnaJ domain-containing protein [Nostocaceae cyanobacterium]